MSLRTKHGRIAAVGLGVAAVTMFGAVVPAFAAPAPTRTVASTSTPSVGVGATAKLKAVVKPVTGTAKPTGTVVFREGTTTLGSAPLALVGTAQTAKLNVTTLAIGSHQITATYNGTTDFATSTSLPVTVVVGKTGTTMTVSSSTPTPTPGQAVKVKAVVKQSSGTVKPSGSVTFTEGATTLGTATLAVIGKAPATASLTIPAPGLPQGAHVITATYAATTTFNGSSGTVTVTVGKGNTASTLTATPSDTTPGKTTIVALVKAVAPAKGVPTGTVSFVVDNNTGAPQIIALSSTGRAQFTVTFPVGSTHTVRVTYAGDNTFLGSNAGPISFTS